MDHHKTHEHQVITHLIRSERRLYGRARRARKSRTSNLTFHLEQMVLVARECRTNLNCAEKLAKRSSRIKYIQSMDKPGELHRHQ